MKKVSTCGKSFLMILSVISLLSSCTFEEAEQEDSREIQYTVIPVSPAFDMELLLDHGGPWVVTMYETGEPRGIWANNVFQAEDGTDMFFATVSVGSGLISTKIQGYDPVNETMYTLCDRFNYDYRFFMYENELFIEKVSPGTMKSVGIFRPVLNQENLSFDLVEVDDELSDLIRQQMNYY